MVRRLLRTVAVFGLLGLVGPVFRMVIPPTLDPIGMFVHQLTWFVWPTQALGVMEVSVGRLNAFLAAAGANVLIFLTLGVLLALLGGTRAGIGIFGALVAFLLGYWAWFGAGYDVQFIHYGALLVALLLYAVPVVVMRRKGWLGLQRPRTAA
jgi:hypothetical protein